jgi:hypothetical protein
LGKGSQISANTSIPEARIARRCRPISARNELFSGSTEAFPRQRRVCAPKGPVGPGLQKFAKTMIFAASQRAKVATGATSKKTDCPVFRPLAPNRMRTE